MTGFCYRMLGSVFESDDAVQETMVRAWRSVDSFEGRSSVRSWMYRIATNVCLDMLRSRQRRALAMDLGPAATAESFLGTTKPESAWVTPIPDSSVVPDTGDPAELAASREIGALPEGGLHQGRGRRLLRQGGAGDGPHLTGRAVTLRRFPEGVDDLDAAFFEKRCPKHRPKWVKTTRVEAGPHAGKIDFCVCDSLPTLIWMAQLAAIELHPSLSLSRAPKRPTVLAFDLDPGPPADIVDCCRVGLRLRDLFGHFDVESFPKTSGSKGLQIYVPLNREAPTSRPNRSPKRSPSCSRSRPPTRSSRR